jgi:hypothetical protein
MLLRNVGQTDLILKKWDKNKTIWIYFMTEHKIKRVSANCTNDIMPVTKNRSWALSSFHSIFAFSSKNTVPYFGDGYLLGCCVVQSDGSWPTASIIMAMEAVRISEMSSTSTWLQGATSQKTAIFVIVTVRNWNLTFLTLPRSLVFP